MLWAFHVNDTELFAAVLFKFAGAVGAGDVGAVACVVALIVDAAEPLALVAVNWKSYFVFAAKPVIVVLVAFAAGAVAFVHVVVPATLNCNV